MPLLRISVQDVFRLSLLGDDARVTWVNNETPEGQKLIADHDLVARTAPVFIVDDTTVLESMLRVKMMLDNSE
ncbi:hypothetical protein KQH65_12125 [archaeon]|nr:hypothetical protein [archaeon]